MTLEDEAARASAMLAGKVVAGVTRHRGGEVVIAFADGMRLFVDSASPLELSITG